MRPVSLRVPRRASGIALAALLCWPAAAHGQSASTQHARWERAPAIAAGFAAHRRGQVAFALIADGRRYGRLDRRAFQTQSTVKVMLLAAYLRDPRVRARALTRTDRGLLRPMVTASDNVAADAVVSFVGPGAMTALAGRAGMPSFRRGPDGHWGLSRASAVDMAAFMWAFEHLVPARHRAYAMSLLASVVPSQRWGVARVVPAGWSLHFKSGWGDASGSSENQVALLARGPRRIALAIMQAHTGSRAHGHATERGIAARLLAGLG